ncbi:MAG: hypothetical protein LQ338_005305 [Usnochroma carphineum]|nr:MAG: hypothetical protein LQ338_005305 [Usnochroma carphineum]
MGIENEILLPLSADHSSICKFQSSDDPLYRQVKGLINEFVKKGVSILASRKQMSALAAGVQSSLGQKPHLDPSAILPNPFLQITREERDNALKTSELQPMYRATAVKDFRIQKVKLLHGPPWETLEEEIIHKDHWWPPVSDEARSIKGKWMTRYPPGTKLATISLSVDWHAYEGDARSPLIEWTIDTPDSEYYPGKHHGNVYVKNLPLGVARSTLLVGWKSAIYSPFVLDRDMGQGNVISERIWKDEPVDLTELLDPLAHTLVFGPFDSTTGFPPPLLRLRIENGWLWRCYRKQDSQDKEAFMRAASFFSRAYNQDISEHADSANQEELEQKSLVTSIKTVKELLQLYNPELLRDGYTRNWDYRGAFARSETRRSWALEERKWADKLIEACNLGFLKLWRTNQVQQEEYQKYLAMRTKNAVGT